MRQTLLLLSLLFSVEGFCQDRFTKFVQQKQIVFATQITDTIHFSDPNVSLLLRQHLSAGKIRSIIPSEEKIQVLKYAGPDEVRMRIAPNQVVKLVDGEGNETGTVVDPTDPLLHSRYFDEQTQDLLEVPQILYVECGRLKSHIPYVSTKYAVIPSWGQKLGISNAFHTAINTDRRLSSRTIKKATALGNSKTIIRLDTVNSNTLLLKVLYGQNLLEALWPSLHKKDYLFSRMDTQQAIPFKKLHMGLLSGMAVPVYDADGRVSATKSPMDAQPLLPTAFNEMQLSQSWFYNEKKNVFFTRITEVTLYAPDANNAPGIRVNKAVLKILLK